MKVYVFYKKIKDLLPTFYAYTTDKKIKDLFLSQRDNSCFIVRKLDMTKTEFIKFELNKHDFCLDIRVFNTKSLTDLYKKRLYV